MLHSSPDQDFSNNFTHLTTEKSYINRSNKWCGFLACKMKITYFFIYLLVGRSVCVGVFQFEGGHDSKPPSEFFGYGGGEIGGQIVEGEVITEIKRGEISIDSCMRGRVCMLLQERRK